MEKPKKTAYILGLMIVTTILCMQVPAIYTIPLSPATEEKTLYIRNIDEPILLGGPVIVEPQRVPLVKAKVAKPTAMGTDIMVSGLPELERNPTLAIDNQNTMMLWYECTNAAGKAESPCQLESISDMPDDHFSTCLWI